MASKKEGKQQKQSPFFARYLEGQEDLEPNSSARVGGQKHLAYKKGGPSGPIQTLKYPSDGDELHLCPYYHRVEDVPKELAGKGAVTLKYPSDNDEYAYNADYVDVKDVPKGRAAKPKETKVKLKRSKKW